MTREEVVVNTLGHIESLPLVSVLSGSRPSTELAGLPYATKSVLTDALRS